MIIQFLQNMRILDALCETQFDAILFYFIKGFIDRLHVNLDILVILILYFFSFFLMRRESVIRSVVPQICVHQGKISAAAGFEPGTLGL